MWWRALFASQSQTCIGLLLHLEQSMGLVRLVYDDHTIHLLLEEKFVHQLRKTQIIQIFPMFSTNSGPPEEY